MLACGCEHCAGDRARFLVLRAEGCVIGVADVCGGTVRTFARSWVRLLSVDDSCMEREAPAIAALAESQIPKEMVTEELRVVTEHYTADFINWEERVSVYGTILIEVCE